MKNIETISLNPEKKIYFASDFHLGTPNAKNAETHATSQHREKRIIQWLDEISKDAQTVFLLGDIFDFWFEYKHVVPKGHVRILGKLAEMTDKGIDVRLFVGNHDLWTFGYFEQEVGLKIYHKPQLLRINETLCFVGHGDCLGPSYRGNKFFKKIFTCRLNQRLFAFLHPWIGIGFASFSSQESRTKTGENEATFTSVEKEALCIFCTQYLKKQPDVAYFIFGHRHLPLDIKLSETSTYFNTGDWLNYDSYVVLETFVSKLKCSLISKK